MCGNCMEACKKEALTLAKATEPAPGVAPFGKNAPRKGNDNKPNGAKDAGTRAQNKPQNKPMAQPKPEDAVAVSATETTDAPKRKPRRRKPRTTGEENTIDSGRRAVLASTALLAGAAVLRAQHKPKTTDGGYAPIIKKTAPQRQHRITPPGSLSVRNLQSHCTACQLCVDACPNDVLRPSTRLSTFMQPEVSYERGYCRPECNRCSEVCPTGAIKPITIEERTATQVGHAVWVKELCIPAKEGKPCGNCSRRCPAGAIQLVPANDKYRKNEHGRWIGPDGKQIDGRLVPMIPVVNVEKCTGCGACENLCPVGPQSAIYVEGHDVHREI
ncbi:MAG: 4Fe-4S dicluster domain-containing protein [Bacteroidaceae bacterium]|nr:4Fe-4S dicluster domain-containing protein [Bacteroidaceae bacterium]